MGKYRRKRKPQFFFLRRKKKRVETQNRYIVECRPDQGKKREFDRINRSWESGGKKEL